MGSPIMMGATLVPRGEFSLVLAKAAADAGYGSTVIYPVIGVTVLVTSFSRIFSSRIRKIGIGRAMQVEKASQSEESEKPAESDGRLD